MTLLVDAFDTMLFDLDGVVYVGPNAVPHAAESIADLRRRDVRCVFVTNNAARPAQAVAEHLTSLGVTAGVDDVVTSPQAAVSLLPQYVPAGSKVLVIGGAGIVEALTERGYVPVGSLDDEPAAVMQGYSPDLGWKDLAEATYAVASGLPWIATNPDLTFPTVRGIAPGNGAMVKVVADTTGRQPLAFAGKPEPPLLHEAMVRAGGDRVLMIGDRLDTDIEAGYRVGIPSLLVFTGVTRVDELLGARVGQRPDYVGTDLRVLAADYPEVSLDDSTARCGAAIATVSGDRLEVAGDGIDAVRAAAALAWRCADLGRPLDFSAAASSLLGAATE